MTKNITITGYGVVARELIQLIDQSKDNLLKKYGVEFKVSAIGSSQGMITATEGIDLAMLLKFGTGSSALKQYAEATQQLLLPTRMIGDVLVECSPTNTETGGAGLVYFNEAMDAQMDIVSVAKGALVHSFKEIQQKAKDNKVRIKYSGATAAALPTLDIGEFSLAGTTITKIEGVLNGTSNYILSAMDESQLSFTEALKIAQENEIAESNPKLDVAGFDSAAKILLLTNGLLEKDFSIQDVEITGIENISKTDIELAKQAGKTIKLLAQAVVEKDEVRMEVKPCAIELTHPLAHIHGTNKGIVFETIEMGTICTTGGASHPRGAAAAALKDLINLYRKDML